MTCNGAWREDGGLTLFSVSTTTDVPSIKDYLISQFKLNRHGWCEAHLQTFFERIINFASFYCGGWRCGVPGECPMVTKFLQSFIAVRQRRPDTICSRAPGRGTMKEKSFGTDLSSLRLSEDVVTRQQPRDNPRCYIITSSHHSVVCHIVTVPLVLLRPHLRLALAPVSRPNW